MDESIASVPSQEFPTAMSTSTPLETTQELNRELLDQIDAIDQLDLPSKEEEEILLNPTDPTLTPPDTICGPENNDNQVILKYVHGQLLPVEFIRIQRQPISVERPARRLRIEESEQENGMEEPLTIGRRDPPGYKRSPIPLIRRAVEAINLHPAPITSPLPSLMSLKVPKPVAFEIPTPNSGNTEKGKEILLRNRPERPTLESFPLVPLKREEFINSGIMFRGQDPKGLDPVTTDPEVDPPFNVCFNCRQTGHTRRDCKNNEVIKIMCYNCGREGVTLLSCPRCKRPHARDMYLKYVRQMGGEARPIWEIYPNLFAAPPYGDE